MTALTQRSFFLRTLLSAAVPVLAASATALAGCHADVASSGASPAAAERTAQTAAALSVSPGDVFAIAGTSLEQGSIGGAFTAVGDAYSVTALAGYRGHVYVASNGALWERGAIGPGTGNAWTKVGLATDAIAMTYHQGQLFMVADNQLWVRTAVGPGSDWSYAGDANGVTAMASFNGHLYVTSNNALWQRGAIGPGTGNDWSYAGDAYGVTAMTASGGHLYVVSNGQLWQRGAIGPGTGNDWTAAGPAPGIAALTTIPVTCTKGLSGSDCPAAGVDLTGLTNVAQSHPATQSSTFNGQTANLGNDQNTGTFSATNVEPTPSWSVDLGFDRDLQVVSLDTDTPSATIDLLDGSGNVLASQAVSGLASTQGFYVWSFQTTTARSVRVRATAAAPGVSLHVYELQAFASIFPAGMFPLSQHVSANGACWKNTYGRGAGAPVSTCGAGLEENGALCYPTCADGYYGVGPVCWQSCPAGWTDTGAFCHHDGSIISADNSSCPWYDECGLTFAKGCSVCPDGYTNDGCTCRIDPQDFAKSSYGRGAGVPLQCAANQQEQAALCYTPCLPGYDGVGPVCWGQCSGAYSVDCGGLACATDANSCVSFIDNIANASVNFVVNIAGLVEGFGETGEAVTVGEAVAAGISSDQAATLQGKIAQALLETGEGLNEGAAEGTAMAVVNGLITGQIDWTMIDPTGIAALVIAFDQPLC